MLRLFCCRRLDGSVYGYQEPEHSSNAITNRQIIYLGLFDDSGVWHRRQMLNNSPLSNNLFALTYHRAAVKMAVDFEESDLFKLFRDVNSSAFVAARLLNKNLLEKKPSTNNGLHTI